MKGFIPDINEYKNNLKKEFSMKIQRQLNNELRKNAEKGHLDIVKSLIKQGADINSENAGGYTALMKSSSSGHLGIVKYLIENGADIEAKNEYG